jgi:acyl-CoA thioester hydrolase
MSEINLKIKSTYPSWTEASIRYSDLDPNGHVNNGAINAFCEDGRVHFRNSRMIRLGDDILRGFVLVKFSVEYHAILNFPGSVQIGTGVTRVGGSSYSLGQGVFDGDKCIATAEVITVYVPPETQKSTPLTDELREILNGAVASPSA